MTKDKQAQSPEELEELARRYVDLWQDQMTALAADPEFAESLQKVMAAMGMAASGLPAMWSAWPTAMSTLMSAAQPGMTNPHGQETDEKPAGGKQNGSGTAASPGTGKAGTGKAGTGKTGAEAAAAASHGGGPDLGVLEERLAALEQRVLSLEGGSGRTRSRSKAKPKRD